MPNYTVSEKNGLKNPHFESFLTKNLKIYRLVDFDRIKNVHQYVPFDLTEANLWFEITN